jgi:chemotaxis protein histidine kinase CheA
VDAIQDTVRRLSENRDIGDAPLALMLPRLDASIADKAERRDQKPASPRQLVIASESEPIRTDRLVRIPAEKLDVLLAQSGEILVAQRRAEARSEEASQLQDLPRWLRLLAWFLDGTDRHRDLRTRRRSRRRQELQNTVVASIAGLLPSRQLESHFKPAGNPSPIRIARISL